MAGLALFLGLSARTSVSLGVLWCLVPGPLLMAPEIDHLLTFQVMLFAVVLGGAVSTGTGRRWCTAGLAGFVAASAFFISYGALLFLTLAGVMVLARA